MVLVFKLVFEVDVLWLWVLILFVLVFKIVWLFGLFLIVCLCIFGIILLGYVIVNFGYVDLLKVWFFIKVNLVGIELFG